MINPKTRSITLIEVIAFIAVMAAIVLVVMGGLQIPSGRLPAAVSILRKDFQALYFQALHQGDVIRIQFDLEAQTYRVEKFFPPQPEPPREDREAHREWQDLQDEKRREFSRMGIQERRALTLVQRGFFEEILTRQIPEGIELVEFHRADQEQRESNDSFEIIIYPTGEFASSLLVFKNEANDYISFVAEGLQGRARSFNGRITREEWLEGAYR